MTISKKQDNTFTNAVYYAEAKIIISTIAEISGYFTNVPFLVIFHSLTTELQGFVVVVWTKFILHHIF